MLALHPQIHMLGAVEQNMMLKCHYFSAHSSCACTVFFPEAELNVVLLIHTCCSELLFGLRRCEFIPNPLRTPPV